MTPGLSYRAALQNLEEMALRATPKKMRTDSGQQQWVIDEPRCAFITKRVQDKSIKKNVLLVVTVLGEDEMAKWDEENNIDPYAFEKELLAEYEADLAERRAKAKEAKAAMETEAKQAQEHHAARGFQYDHMGAMKEGKSTKPPKGHNWTQVLALIVGENKAICRYESHRETLRKSVDVTVDALREALKTLTEMADCGSQNAQGCVERIKVIDPGFLKSYFIYNTAMEKRRIREDS